MRKLNRNRSLLVAAMAVGLLGSAVNVSQAEEEVVIGVVQALSGPGSVLSPPVIQAAELAAEEVNAAGGILGKKLRLEFGDDGTDARIAERAWDSLINQKGLTLLSRWRPPPAATPALRWR